MNRVRTFFGLLVFIFSAYAFSQHGLVTVGFTGDSITASAFNAFGTQQHTNPNTINHVKADASWSQLAIMGSGGNLVYFRNWAEHGAKSKAIVDNFVNVTLVQKELPKILVVHMGSNDVSSLGAGAFDEVVSQYKRLRVFCKEPRIELIPCTIIPNSSLDPVQLETRNRINAWLRGFARQYDFRLIDLHSSIVGPDGTIDANLSGDGVHPNSAGHMAMGRVAAKALASYAGNPQPFLTQAGGSGDRLNLLYNGAFMPFVDRPEGWTGLSFTAVGGTGIQGIWARYSSASHTEPRWLLDSGLRSVTPGHTLVLAGRIRTLGLSEGWGLYFRLTFMNSGGQFIEELWPIDAGKFLDNFDSDGGYVLNRRLIVPVGATQARLQILTSNVPNSYSVDIAQLTLYDLSNMGLAPSYP